MATTVKIDTSDGELVLTDEDVNEDFVTIKLGSEEVDVSRAKLLAAVRVFL